MQDTDKSLAQLKQLEHDLAAQVAAMAQVLDAPLKARDSKELTQAWSAIRASHSALRALIKSILRDTTALRKTSSDTSRARRVLNTAAKAARTRIRNIVRVNRLIERQINATSAPLFPDHDINMRAEGVIDHVSALFFDALHKIANPQENTQSSKAKDAGLHRDIPLPMDRFSTMLGAAYRLCLAQRKNHGLRFLDVGSGGGTKVLAATTVFETSHGLEYESHSVKTGTEMLDLLGTRGCALIYGDALAFSEYGSYDAIYYYRPLRSTEGMIELEARIFAQAKPGTIILVPNGLVTPDADAQHVHHIAGHVYVTGMSAADADALHEAACYIGASIPGYVRFRSADPALWAPVLEASRRNGYFF